MMMRGGFEEGQKREVRGLGVVKFGGDFEALRE